MSSLTSAPRWDVFFSYPSWDRPAVEAVVHDLERAGLRVFFDRGALVPGESWLTALDEAIASSAAMAVWVSDRGLGRWQRREVVVGLNQAASRHDFGVIPLLAGGADLGRQGDRLALAEEHALRIEDGDIAVRLRAILATPARPLAVCPWPGLRHYDVGDEPFFCGRTAITRELMGVLRDARGRVVQLTGDSGAGKSSLARAGLMANLGDLAPGPSPDRWLIIDVRPGTAPLESLARALLVAVRPQRRGDPHFPDDRAKLQASLASHDGALTGYLRDHVLSQPEPPRVFLLVDQLEELFTAGVDLAVQRRFLDHVAALAADAELDARVVTTLRAEFAAGPTVSPAYSAGHRLDVRLVPRMDSAECLREIVELPARRAGLTFESRHLVDTIVAELAAQPGALPIAAYGLARLWDL